MQLCLCLWRGHTLAVLNGCGLGDMPMLERVKTEEDLQAFVRPHPFPGDSPLMVVCTVRPSQPYLLQCWQAHPAT